MQPIFDLFMVKDSANPVKFKIILGLFYIIAGSPCRGHIHLILLLASLR